MHSSWQKTAPKLSLLRIRPHQLLTDRQSRGLIQIGEPCEIGSGSLVGSAVTLSLFTRLLSPRLDRTVVDNTNLDGRFDIRLYWTPAVGEAAALDPSSTVDNFK